MYEHHSKNGTNAATSQQKHRVHDTLLELDGWRLVRPLYPNLTDTLSYIVHWTCSAHSEGRWIGKGGATSKRRECSKCDGVCPDEIIALFILHNGEI